MTSTDLLSVYWDGYNKQINRNSGNPFSPLGMSLAHIAGITAVAGAQAMHDAQIAERFDYGTNVQPEDPQADARARAIAGAIRAENWDAI